jgi:hypothetical protein
LTSKTRTLIIFSPFCSVKKSVLSRFWIHLSVFRNKLYVYFEILKDEFKFLTGRTFSRNKMARKLSVFSSLISNYSFNNNFCQKIIIYLESLYNKLYFDIKFVKIFILYRFKKKIDICIKIKLFLNTFQIYNYLLTEISIKRIIWHQRREHWTFSRNKMARKLSVLSSLMSNYSFNTNFCQQIIIYLKTLYNKLYFDIKFIWKYWKMNSIFFSWEGKQKNVLLACGTEIHFSIKAIHCLQFILFHVQRKVHDFVCISALVVFKCHFLNRN